MIRGIALFAVALALAGCKKPAPVDKPAVRVAAASDLALAFKEVGAAFEKQTGQKVIFSFGSTGLLAKQIAEGAPFDLFAAANMSFVDDVVKAGTCDAATKSLYARGQITVWTRKGASVAPPKSLAELADPRFAHVAIANPEHAPYGRAAREALEKSGIFEQLKPRLVYGENVQQTLQFAQSGNAEAALVALSLAMQSDGDWFVVDDSLHKPLDQALVVCGHSPGREGALAFSQFVASPPGRAIMQRYGFLLPGEPAPHGK
jgi:molybdate transport system substrate-binding protein